MDRNPSKKNVLVWKTMENFSIRWWSDDRYARYDTKKYIYKQQIRHLKKLFKEVELAEHNDELAYDGAMDHQEPPF